MPPTSKIMYNPSLSVKENAKRNVVSEAGIRYYIQANGIDRRYEQKSKVVNACKKYLKKHPGATKNEIHRELGFAVSTIRGYWDYITCKKELEHNNTKVDSRKQRYNQILSSVPIDYIKQYLVEHENPKQYQKIVELKALIDEMKEVEKKNGKSLQFLPPPTLDVLTRWEEYDASKYLCYAFRKTGDVRKGKVLLNLGNMCGGYGYDMQGVHFKNSEAAYICGLFSDNEPEHIRIQQELIHEDSGFNAKKFIRTPNQDKARKDWNEFNQQWMLYVVWQKVKGNEAFRKMLLAIPDGAAIIEDSSFQKGATATFWGTKNNERHDFYQVVKKYINATETEANDKDKDKMLLDAFNNFTDYGTYRGSNVMGKILTICRNCLREGTEPPIDYELLRSKHIHLLGKELTF